LSITNSSGKDESTEKPTTAELIEAASAKLRGPKAGAGD
jgi:hypothetical protein